MVISRGELWWADLPEPAGSGSGYSRPVLIVQSDFLNNSRLGAVTVLTLTTNLRLAQVPGNILLTMRQSKLPKESVIVASQVNAIDRSFLRRRVSSLSPAMMKIVDEGLRLALSL